MEFLVILIVIAGGAFVARRYLQGSEAGGPSAVREPRTPAGEGSAPGDRAVAPAAGDSVPGAPSPKGSGAPGGFGPENDLEAVLQEVAQDFAVRAASGEDWIEILQSWSSRVSEAAARLHDVEGPKAVGTAQSFFGAHVAVNLQANPQMRGPIATNLMARADHWVDSQLGPFLEETEARHFDLSSESDGDESDELARGIWRAAGLNIAIHGPGPADELVEVLNHWAPQLRGRPEGPLLQLAEPNLRLWIVLLEGPAGSCCIISEATLERDGNFDAERLSPGILPVEMLNSPPPTRDGQGAWETTIFSRGLTDSEELANRVREGRLLPPLECGSLVRA